MAQHAGSPVAVSLKIKHPLAVNDAEVQLVSEKSHTAVSLDSTGVTLVKAFPFAVYAVPDVFVISSVAV